MDASIKSYMKIVSTFTIKMQQFNGCNQDYNTDFIKINVWSVKTKLNENISFQSQNAVMRRLLWCDIPSKICSVAVEFAGVVRCHLGEVLENVLTRFISCKEKTAWLWRKPSAIYLHQALNTHTTAYNQNSHRHREMLIPVLLQSRNSAGGNAEVKSTWHQMMHMKYVYWSFTLIFSM